MNEMTICVQTLPLSAQLPWSHCHTTVMLGFGISEWCAGNGSSKKYGCTSAYRKRMQMSSRTLGSKALREAFARKHSQMRGEGVGGVGSFRCKARVVSSAPRPEWWIPV